MCIGARIRWDHWSNEGSRAEQPSLWSKEVTVPTGGEGKPRRGPCLGDDRSHPDLG